MYYGSGTVDVLGGLAGSRRTVGGRHGGHLESMTSNWSVNRCVFTWRTILPNFIPIRFETMEP